MTEVRPPRDWITIGSHRVTVYETHDYQGAAQITLGSRRVHHITTKVRPPVQWCCANDEWGTSAATDCYSWVSSKEIAIGEKNTCMYNKHTAGPCIRTLRMPIWICRCWVVLWTSGVIDYCYTSMESSSLSSKLTPSSTRSLSPPSLPSSSSSTICLRIIHPSQQCTTFISSPAGLQRHRPPTHGPQSGRSCAQEPSSQCAGQAYGGLGIILHCKNDWVTLTQFGHLSCKSSIVLCNSGNQNGLK